MSHEGSEQTNEYLECLPWAHILLKFLLCFKIGCNLSSLLKLSPPALPLLRSEHTFLCGEHLPNCPSVKQGSLSMRSCTSMGKGCFWGINSLALLPTPWEDDLFLWAEKALKISSKAA